MGLQTRQQVITCWRSSQTRFGKELLAHEGESLVAYGRLARTGKEGGRQESVTLLCAVEPESV